MRISIQNAASDRLCVNDLPHQILAEGHWIIGKAQMDYFEAMVRSGVLTPKSRVELRYSDMTNPYRL